MKLTWQDNFSVGVKELDRQHKRLLELINDLSDKNPDHSINNCFAVLNELIKYAQLHFATEESLMATHGYNDLHSHQNDHEAFTERIFELNQKLTSQGADIFPDLIIFVTEWYISHVLGTDKNYKNHFEAKGVT